MRGGALLDPAIQALFLAGGEVADERSLVRQIVETERWYVPIQPDGSFIRLSSLDERTLRAFARPLAADGSGA